MKYEEKFREILEELFELWKKKQSDYGEESWLEMGLKMKFADICRKYKRLETLIWYDKIIQNKQETIRHTMIDLVVYGILGVMFIDEKGLDE